MTTGDMDQAARDPDDEIGEAQTTYTMVDALTRGQRRRVDELDAKFEHALADVDAHLGSGLEHLTARFDALDGRLVGIHDRLDQLEERLSARVEGLEATLREVLRRLPDAH